MDSKTSVTVMKKREIIIDIRTWPNFTARAAWKTSLNETFATVEVHVY